MVDKSHSAEISRLTDLLHSNPGSRLFVPLAEAYLQSDRLEEAIQVLSEGLKTHSSFVAARVMMGKIYLKKAQPPEAKEQFEQVLTIAPSNIPSLKGLAGIYKKEAQFEEAKRTYLTILKIDPGDKEARGFLETQETILETPAAQETPETRSIAETQEEQADKTPVKTISESPKGNDTRDTPPVSEAVPEAIQETLPETIAENPAQEPGPEPLPQREEDIITPSEALETLEPHETKTMAALYLRQGHYQEAADIYETLLKHDPMDQQNQKGLEGALAHLKNEEKTPLSKTEKIERLQLWLETMQGEKKR